MIFNKLPKWTIWLARPWHLGGATRTYSFLETKLPENSINIIGFWILLFIFNFFHDIQFILLLHRVAVPCTCKLHTHTAPPLARRSGSTGSPSPAMTFISGMRVLNVGEMIVGSFLFLFLLFLACGTRIEMFALLTRVLILSTVPAFAAGHVLQLPKWTSWQAKVTRLSHMHLIFRENYWKKTEILLVCRIQFF